MVFFFLFKDLILGKVHSDCKNTSRTISELSSCMPSTTSDRLLNQDDPVCITYIVCMKGKTLSSIHS